MRQEMKTENRFKCEGSLNFPFKVDIKIHAELQLTYNGFYSHTHHCVVVVVIIVNNRP